MFCSWRVLNDWNWFQTVLCIWDRSVHLWIIQPSTSKCMPCCPRGILIWMRAWSLRRPGTADSEMKPIAVLQQLDMLRLSIFCERSRLAMAHQRDAPQFKKTPINSFMLWYNCGIWTISSKRKITQLWKKSRVCNLMAPFRKFFTKYHHLVISNLRARLRQLRQNNVTCTRVVWIMSLSWVHSCRWPDLTC